MAKVSKAGQRETKETQRNGKSIKIALMMENDECPSTNDQLMTKLE
jgi:hypothetical protein